jgi:hypothetical protein
MATTATSHSGAIQRTFIPELLQSIVEQLVAHPNVLVALSQVTQLTSDFALDVLWRTIPTAFYILKLLPSFALVDGKYVCNFKSNLRWLKGHGQRLTRDVLPGEWSAFDRYSSRIHEFISLFSSVEFMGVDDIELDIFVKIQRLRPGRELFTALRVLITPVGLNRRGL